MKSKQAVAIQKKVMLLVAAEESGAVPVGGCPSCFHFKRLLYFQVEKLERMERGEEEKKQKQKQVAGSEE